MKIHPEVKELLDEEMREGLRYWRDTSPEEINKRFRARLLADQKPFKNPMKGITWEWKYVGCDCGGYVTFLCTQHYPWCTGRRVPVFSTPQQPKEIDGRLWYSGYNGGGDI